MQDRAFDNDKIDFLWDSVLTDIDGDGKVQRARVKNLKTGDESDHDVDGIFVAIGHIPNTALFEGQLDLIGGYIEKRAARTREPRCPAFSRPGMSSTSGTGRRSRPPGWAAWRRSTPSAT